MSDMTQRTKKWNPVPNEWGQWTKEQNFAYRLREIMYRAFYNGAKYGAANPAVMDRPPIMSMREMMELPDFVGDEFAAWAARQHFELEAAFDLSEKTLRDYFPEPK